MPEIKHTFTGGKMNKDLDIRHVPQGEYRHAENIQVRTTDAGDSDGGDSGTVQNIRGNISTGLTIPEKFDFGIGSSDYAYNVSSSSQKETTVAMVADEKSDKVYSFIAAPPVPADTFGMGSYNTTVNKIFVDAIVERDVKNNALSPVLIDHFCTTSSAKKGGIVNLAEPFWDNGPWFSIPLTSDILPALDAIEGASIDQLIRVGMRVRFIDSLGNNILDNAVIDMINTDTIVLSKQQVANCDDVVYVVFEADRVLKFNTSEPDNSSNQSSLPNLITGINIIDNLLFWTDNTSEPKKINIDRCKAGCVDFKTHTKLFLKDPSDGDELIQGIGNTAIFLNPTPGLPITPYIREEHITVMRQAPNTAPTLEMRVNDRLGIVNASNVPIDFTTFGGIADLQIMTPIEEAFINNVSWRPGDRLVFTTPIDTNGDGVDDDEASVIASIVSIGDSYVDIDGIQKVDYTLLINGVLNEPNPTSAWEIRLEQEKPIFETKLCRFGYRYKYEDGEYSSFSPWSEVAFLPGAFDYEPRKGYNLGMVNSVRHLVVKDFIPHVSMRPEDVVSVDILYKTTDNANVYVVKTVTRKKSNEWDLFTYSIANQAWEFGRLEITSEMIHRSLPSNQLLRAWDYVPKYAKAQDIVGNRIVYGNFNQGYNTTNLVSLNQQLKAIFPKPTLFEPKKSIKSIRKYKFGMVFGDEYGRETPVVAPSELYGTNQDTYVSSTGDLEVPKDMAAYQNKITLQQVWDNPTTGEPDDWMEYVKYYVKETSNEYYNLVLDRWYFAEDGNVWLSFQSADRNKIDDETYLILKNENGSNIPVVEKARYKVIAIKNEAPEFIKLEERIMGDIAVEDNGATWEYVFSDPATADTNDDSPIVLQTGTELRIETADNWDFFKDYEKRGALKIRIVGQTVNTLGDVQYTRRSPWKNITNYKMNATNEIITIHWDEPFGTTCNMKNIFDAAGLPLNVANRLGYHIEIKEEIVKNKPEFDGKFFVKVEKDAVLMDRVLGFNNDTVDYSTDATWDIAYIDTQLVNPGVQNLYPLDFTTSPGAIIPARTAIGVADYSSYVFMNAKSSGTAGTFREPTAWAITDPLDIVVGKRDTGSLLLEGNGYWNDGWSNAQAELNCDDSIGDDASFGGFLPRATRFALGCLGDHYTPDNVQLMGLSRDGNQGLYGSQDDLDSDSYTIGTEDWWVAINMGKPTKRFWEWWKSNGGWDSGAMQLSSPNARLFDNDTEAAMFVDSARAWNFRWNNAQRAQDWGNATSSDVAYGYPDDLWVNNDGPFPPNSDNLRSSWFYKPTGFDRGVCSDPFNYFDPEYSPTALGHFGRCAVSIIAKAGSGFENPASEAGKFRELVSQEGNYFGFEDDPFNNVYRIVSNPSNQGFHESSTALRPRNFAREEYTGRAAFFTNESSNVTMDFLNPDIGLVQPLLIGKFENDVFPSNQNCRRCPSSSQNCVRQSIRFEFRRVNKTTGELEANGTYGIEIDQWDPRSKLTHDGRTVIQWDKLMKIETFGAPGKATKDNACFETEPKEDIGLDLYYEASHSIPMKLNAKNTLQFAPLFSPITVNRVISGSTSIIPLLGTNHHVKHVGHTSTNPVIFINSTNIDGDNIAHETDIMIGDYLIFTHPDGLETRAKVTNFMTPLINGDIEFPNPANSVFFPFTQSQYAPIEGEVIGYESTYGGWEQGGSPVIAINGNDQPLEVGMIVNVVGPAIQVPPGGIEISGIIGIVGPTTYITVDNFDWLNTNFVGQNQYQVYKCNTVIYDNKGFYEIETDVWKNLVLLSWHNCWSFGNGVESDRIRDDYNAPQMDNGVVVSTVSEEYGEQQLGSRLLYSGLYNSTSGVNDLNEFNIGEKITKDLNPSYGSIQALKTRNTDIVAFCEDKTLKILANKDAVYNADGNPQLLATNRVLGTASPFAGDYGISQNPESLAVDQFRMYFTDKQRGAVLRLSGDGLTPISNVGMKSYFRENIKNHEQLIGSFDVVLGEYNLSMRRPALFSSEDTTVVFNEGAKGWISFRSFVQESGVSCTGAYFTGVNRTIYQHHASSVARNNFYGSQYESLIDVVFNDQPSSIKSFYTLNYEGSQAKVNPGIITDNTVSWPAVPSGPSAVLDAGGYTIESTVNTDEFYNLNEKRGWYVESFETDMQSGAVPEFINKENKWFNKICGLQTTEQNIDTSEFTFQGLGRANISFTEGVTATNTLDVDLD